MAKKSIKIPKILKARVYAGISNIINRKDSGLPEFPTRYFVHKPSPGIFKILKEKENELVEYVPDQELVSDVMKYLLKHCSKNENYCLTAKECGAAVELWLNESDAVAEPKMFTWPGETGLTFSKLPWLAEEGLTPTWDSIIARMSNSEAFCDWIGSLFIEDSSLQDYCWLYGQGNDGKGCINRFLYRIFNDAYGSKQPPEKGDKFWNFGLLGKRIVVFPDCNNRSFITSGLFKAFTGGDPVSIEEKGKMSYTKKLNAKFLFLSNERPDISSETADIRRIVYCEFIEQGGNDKDFEENLWAEGGKFIGKCINGYLARYPDRLPIGGDKTLANLLADQNESEYQSFFDDHFLSTRFHWEELKELEPAKIREITIKSAIFNSIISTSYKSKFERKNFVEWLCRKYGAKYNQQKIGGIKERFYSGFYLKPSVGSSKFIRADLFPVP